MEKEKGYTITIRNIDDDTRKKLKMLSFETNKTINSLVIEFIKEGLNKGGSKNAR